ncbi:MAG: NTP transferase domain-containing protein [Candidatus Levybacteria bacterium]|nr:NTP transferase domain-containing protein [Candidatus Levybacteria bacterium]
MIERKLGAIILAAGRGKRMEVDGINKVTLSLAKKPIIVHIVQFMKKLGAKATVVVVGFAKESVMQTLADANEDVIYAEQKELLGTGHAAQSALTELPEDITDVIIVYGDDAVIYIDEHLPMMSKLFETHYASNAAFTFLTIEKEQPFGLGRIMRDDRGKVLAIVEEKDATEEQKRIKEINPGCFIFKVSFLKKYLSMVKKSSATGEYYLTSLIDLAIKDDEHVETLKGGYMAWRGVNTKAELEEAELLLNSMKKINT